MGEENRKPQLPQPKLGLSKEWDSGKEKCPRKIKYIGILSSFPNTSSTAP